MIKAVTRREFLGRMAAGFVLFTAGCSAKTFWPVRGSEKGSLRLVFYTDVHARTEWETPVALTRATEAINAQKADLIIAGGDLITDGFQSSADRVAPRWDAYMKMHREIKGDLYPVIGNHDLVAAVPERWGAGSQRSTDNLSVQNGSRSDILFIQGCRLSFRDTGFHPDHRR